jgi:hypothetical protein
LKNVITTSRDRCDAVSILNNTSPFADAQPDIRRVLSNPSMLRQLEDLAATEEDVDTSGVPTDAQTVACLG